MLWCAVEADSNEAPARFFEGFAKATVPHRRYVEPRISLWGLTRRSQYSKSRSRQEVDPFGEKRAPYLIIYPFTKTVDWYLMNQETRQGMMNEHIRIGKRYESIKQLLLYSFGLQDQEFVVVYETDDLAVFSQLVNDLRMTEARRFTLGDTRYTRRCTIRRRRRPPSGVEVAGFRRVAEDIGCARDVTQHIEGGRDRFGCRKMVDVGS